MSDARAKAWHWPTFDRIICGTMTDRERLGLPEHFVALRFEDDIVSAYRTLRHAPAAELIALCESTGGSLLDRLVAGNLLGLVGDPRIDLRNPTMMAIPGAAAEIGLAPVDLEATLSRHAELGLRRSWLEKECPRHRVTLAPYSLAKYPVTNAEYRAFLLATHYPELPTSWEYRRFPSERANHPVYTVSPAAADAYISWLCGVTGRRFRLPGEAEWEYAAAGPAGLEFPWGDEFVADCANTLETGLFQTSPVGVFTGGLSPFGLSDMAGNVEEYVAANNDAYPGGTFVHDDLADIHASHRVARGGCFARFRDLARTRRRHGHNPRSVTYAMGFRLAEDLG